VLVKHVEMCFRFVFERNIKTQSIESKRVQVVSKAVVDVPCNLQRGVINLQRVVDINQ